MFFKQSKKDARAEQNLLEEKNFSNTLHQHLPLAEITPEGKVLYASDSYLELLGMKQGQLEGTNIQDTFLKDGANSNQKPWLFHEPQHRAFGKFTRRHQNGSKLYIKSQFVHVENLQGQVDKIVEIAYDVTEQTITALKNLDNKRALDRSTAIIEFDTQGNIQEANANFLSVMGYRLEELVGKHHRIFCDSEFQNSHDYKTLWNNLNRGEYVKGRMKRIHKNGDIIWLEASYNPLIDESGKVYGVVKFATDITALIEQNLRESESAQRAFAIASETEQAAAEGADVVQKASHGMEKITSAVGDAAHVIAELGKQSEEITSIVNTIRGIADQTNLLALNAAIEAARAGEQGRGFAVVADEVRQLAARTSRSTQEISDMIGKIQTGTSTAIDSMNECQKQAENSMSLAQEAGAVIVKVREGTQNAVSAVSIFSTALKK
ncbi:MAG: methyl-accepting chemotaxis protein [Oleibacter sp.]|nr:methyl-accepting chemotaxis protein [Thalassolituus sp.]